MGKKITLLLTILVFIILFGCDSPTSDTANKESSGLGGDTEQIPDDYVSGGSTETGDSAAPAEYTVTGTNPVVFETDGAKYIKPQGYTFWQRRGTLPIKETLTGLTVKLAKMSGHSNGGYGVFFCEGNGRMLTVLLRIDGSYCLGEVLNSTYNESVPWTSTSYLTTGTGVENTVHISWDSVSSDYILSINGSVVQHFTDSIAPVTGTGFGYVAVLTGQENFPGTPVRISFEKI
jgi:hypothetical protein